MGCLPILSVLMAFHAGSPPTAGPLTFCVEVWEGQALDGEPLAGQAGGPEETYGL